MAGIGFGGQGYTWNKDNLSQINRRGGFERQEENYAERASLLRSKQPTPEELAAFRQQFYTKQKRQQRQERIIWLIFTLLGIVAVGWFFAALVR